MARAKLSRLGLLPVALAFVLPAPAAAQVTSAQVTSAQGPFASTAAIDETALAGIAGREDVNQAALANQTAGVADNSVGDNVRTGDARIDGQAFQNVSGLSLLNVNTGNNVAINAAMNVTIAISPAP